MFVKETCLCSFVQLTSHSLLIRIYEPLSRKYQVKLSRHIRYRMAIARDIFSVTSVQNKVIAGESQLVLFSRNNLQQIDNFKYLNDEQK